MIQLVQDTKHIRKNELFNQVIRYYLYKKDLSTVKNILSNVSKYTNDNQVTTIVGKSFLTNHRCNDMFGVAEDIVNMMKNIIFSGNVNIDVDHVKGQELIEKLYYKGQLLDTLKEAYASAAATNGKSYIVMNMNSIYDVTSGVKEKDLFVDFSVYKSWEVEHKKETIYHDETDKSEEINYFERTLYKTIVIDPKENREETFRFVYLYLIRENGTTEVFIKGYNSKDQRIDNESVLKYLEISSVNEVYDIITIFEINVGDTLLPNILSIESNLAEGLYWQQEDLPNSQTHIYTAENALYNLPSDKDKNYEDKYKTRHIIKASLDGQTQHVVEGKSSIGFIKDNILMNMSRACVDAKISPATLGYNLLDRIGNNTDVGLERERNTVRLRENHINKLKIVIAIMLEQYLKLFGIKKSYEKITIIFDSYITPSVETTTNILAKQVQFGLKSRYKAIQDLNKNELSDEEIQKEYERVKEIYTQKDFNVEQENEKLADNDKLKVDNNLKSSGNVE